MNRTSGSAGEGGNMAALLELYRISEDDLDRVREFAKMAGSGLEGLIGQWYEWLQNLPEYDHFFSEPETLERVKRLQQDYWATFLAAQMDVSYLETRRQVGETHARIGLSLNTYFAGMDMMLELFTRAVHKADLKDGAKLNMQESVTKMLHLDTSIVVDTYNHMVEETLTAQAKSLMEMSTPVTQIWSGILLLPIVGIIDSKRARDIMNATLAKIGETQARIFILDISGVGVVDTAVANHLIKITRATRLMGCDCTISGVSPSIAQTIVDLGIDVGRIKTTSTMKDALADAFQRVGMEITQAS
jgi:rsbT co-antagonist protein RsbR